MKGPPSDAGRAEEERTLDRLSSAVGEMPTGVTERTLDAVMSKFAEVNEVDEDT